MKQSLFLTTIGVENRKMTPIGVKIMKRRGRRPIIEKLLEEESKEELEEVRAKLLEVLENLEAHPYIWLVDYDIAPSNKKTFYRNLKRIGAFRRSTKSVIVLDNLSVAIAIKKLGLAMAEPTYI